MSDFIWKEIQKKRLRVIKKYKDKLKGPLTNFGSSKRKYSSFGAFYELYLYAFMLGLHKNKRVDLKDLDTFNEIDEWKLEKKDTFLKLLMTVLSIESVRKEADFDFISLEMEDLDEDQLKKRINHLIQIIEEYANGGFEILFTRYNDFPEEFEHYMGLKKFFDEILESSCLLNGNKKIA